MASALHRTSKRFIRSGAHISVKPVSDAPEDWIINADMSAVTGQPKKYWKIIGDIVSFMNGGERSAADLAIDNANIAADKAKSVSAVDVNRKFMGFEEVFVEQINLIRGEIVGLGVITDAQIKIDIKNKINNG